MVTITRKIQLNVVSEDVKSVYKTLYDWNEQVFRAANIASTHMYFQEKQKEFFYLTGDARVLLSDATIPVENIKSEKTKDEINAGAVRMFNTSKQNTTYRVLSDRLKGTIPADIFSNLNAQLAQTFSKESKEYFSGKRSLRSYRRNMPMPFSAKSIRNIQLTEDGRNYYFDWFGGIRFKTYFGKDLSGNKIIFERSLVGEYKLCNSSIQLDGGKIFLLAVFQFEKNQFDLDLDKELICSLDADCAILIKDGNKEYRIGSVEELNSRRIGIQGARRRIAKQLRYAKGGKGRGKKLQALDRLKDAETNYIQTKLHTYSKMLVDYCLKAKAGTIRLENYNSLAEDVKEDALLLASWSYYGLTEKIVYKAAKNGINVIKN